MYLLNRTCKFSPNASNVFTFHYVSIKSHPVRQELNILRKFTFHYVSIKSDTGTDIETVTQKFTFHYVSIKSLKIQQDPLQAVYLHSTMYLLNPVFRCCLYIAKRFTFHYVSIKSCICGIAPP